MSVILQINERVAPAPLSGMTLELDVQSGDEVTIPHASGFTHNYTINWGDGTSIKTVISWDDPNTTHTYDTTATVRISFAGVVETIGDIVTSTIISNPSQPKTVFQSRLKKVITWGPAGMLKNIALGNSNLNEVPNESGKLSGALTLYGAFYNTQLSTIPSGIFDNFQGTDMGVLFRYVRLSSIPSGLFDLTPNVTNLEYLFDGGITTFTSIPTGLFDNLPDLENISLAFNNTNISDIPEYFLQYNHNLKYAQGTFARTNITQVKGTLFDNTTKLITVYTIFSNCTSLKKVENGLFANIPTLRYANGAFYNCTALDDVGDSMFGGSNNLEDISTLFYNCTSLPSVPNAVITTSSNPNINDVTSCYYNCTNMTGDSDYYYNNFSDAAHAVCYYNCTGLSDYSDIPNDWK